MVTKQLRDLIAMRNETASWTTWDRDNSLACIDERIEFEISEETPEADRAEARKAFEAAKAGH